MMSWLTFYFILFYYIHISVFIIFIFHVMLLCWMVLVHFLSIWLTLLILFTITRPFLLLACFLYSSSETSLTSFLSACFPSFPLYIGHVPELFIHGKTHQSFKSSASFWDASASMASE